ncbi:MAG: hypothetical protein HUK40_10765 [Desulfobacter sp.]|nr:hypothetical protein [Desulfobacter sp.]
MKHRFNAFDMNTMAPMEKIGLCATQTLEGKPHITFINSLMAMDDTCMTLGQFIRGNSKYYLTKNPKAAFFILAGQAKKFWTGKMCWTGKKDQGPELETYKNFPLQRYNAYFPIHRVHYFDLVETTPATSLPVLKLGWYSLLTPFLKGQSPATPMDAPLTSYGKKMLTSPLSLKFLSIIEEDGFPCLIPFIPCRVEGLSKLLFPAGALGKKSIPEHTEVAVFGLKTTLESVLVRGKFTGMKQKHGIKTGEVDIDWVYNSMPPNAGQIYPPTPLKPVTVFE